MKVQPVFPQIFIRVLLAGCAIVISSVVFVSLRGFLSTSVIALLYLLVVVFCTTLGGMISGIAASVLAFFTFNYFFLPPLNTLIVAHSQDIIAMFVFLTVAIVISNLMGRAQIRLEQIQIREREASHLFELSSSLTTIRDEKQIAEILAQNLRDVFLAELVEVKINLDFPNTDCEDVHCVHIRLPENAALDDAYKQSQVLTTNRGILGEIRLWTSNPSLTHSESRLLKTIASQAALAVERAMLANAENRAKVLEESDRLKTAILSSVSHDLRTPLASIQAAASSLNDRSITLEPDARCELQSLLLEQTEHLNQLVGNLLNMSRIEAGALKLQKQWNSLSDLIDTAVEHMRSQVTQHILEVDVSEDLPLIQVDAILIEQVFFNLISNSVKFAPIGSRIIIRAVVQDPEMMQITLINQGPEIPEEHLEHIFEKFYQFPGMKQESSTGLGLSICKGIVEAHGGKIWAENSSAGLTFGFTLPIEKSGVLITLEEEMSNTEVEKRKEYRTYE